MRHIIPPPERIHRPTPAFHNHSRVLAIIMVLVHPYLAYLSLKIAYFGLILHRFLFGFMGNIYGEGSSLDHFEFEKLAESETPYAVTLIITLLVIAWSAGNFQLFRIKKFWLNFVISLLLLFIGLLIFAPTLFAAIL